MRFVRCATCGNEKTPLNDSVSVDKIIFCSTCFKTTYPDVKQLEFKTVETAFDPTVCASCNKDFGDTVLPTLGRYPICENCEVGIKDKISPTWLKAFFAVLIGLVVFSYVWNWRFFRARDEIKEANSAAEMGDYQKAAELMKSASQDASEISDLGHLATYYKGVALLRENKYAEARSQLLESKEFMPSDYDIDFLLLQADLSEGFDVGDYNKFLTAAQGLYSRDTTDLMGAAYMASAYACLYAKTESDSLKKLAQIYVDQAAVGRSDTTISEYLNRIEHRLTTREILHKADFDKKYPTGWKK